MLLLLNVHSDYSGMLLNCILIQEVWGWGLQVCISKKRLGEADIASMGHTMRIEKLAYFSITQKEKPRSKEGKGCAQEHIAEPASEHSPPDSS